MKDFLKDLPNACKIGECKPDDKAIENLIKNYQYIAERNETLPGITDEQTIKELKMALSALDDESYLILLARYIMDRRKNDGVTLIHLPFQVIYPETSITYEAVEAGYLPPKVEEFEPAETTVQIPNEVIEEESVPVTTEEVPEPIVAPPTVPLPLQPSKPEESSVVVEEKPQQTDTTLTPFERREKLKLKTWLIKGTLCFVAVVFISIIAGAFAVIAIKGESKDLSFLGTIMDYLIKVIEVIFNNSST